MKSVILVISLLLMALIPQTTAAAFDDNTIGDSQQEVYQDIQSILNDIVSDKLPSADYKSWEVVKVTDDQIHLQRVDSDGNSEFAIIARPLKPYARVGDYVLYDKKLNLVKYPKNNYKTWHVVDVSDGKITLKRTKSNGEDDTVTIDRSRRPYLKVGDRVRYDKIRDRLKKTLTHENNKDSAGPVAKEWTSPGRGLINQMPLGNTGFYAKAIPYFFTNEKDRDWDFYSIEVFKKLADKNKVFFGRYLTKEELPFNYTNQSINQIAKYDKNTRIVTFSIGTIQFSYTLPDH